MAYRETRIKPEFDKLSPSDFRRKCGDAFIAGYVAGGYFSAIYEFTSQDSVEVRELVASLSGSYAAANLSTCRHKTPGVIEIELEAAHVRVRGAVDATACARCSKCWRSDDCVAGRHAGVARSRGD
jgi:hypothetical protein